MTVVALDLVDTLLDSIFDVCSAARFESLDGAPDYAEVGRGQRKVLGLLRK